MIYRIETWIRKLLRMPRHKGGMACFRCGTRAFLFRGLCEFCEPTMHRAFWRRVENAPPIEAFINQ